jgi:hypothetical protein
MPELSIKTAQYRPTVLSMLERLGHAQTPIKYLTENRYRTYYQQGQLNALDLAAAFRQYPELQAGQVLCSLTGRDICRADVYQAALLYDVEEPNCQHMAWLLAEGRVSDSLQQQFLKDGGESETVSRLWAYLSETVGLTGEKPTVQIENNPLHTTLRQFASAELEQMLAQLDGKLSLREWVQALSGVDILEPVNRQLQHLASVFTNPQDTAWSTQAHQEIDLYGLWRTLARQDAGLFLHQLPDWQNIIAELPEDALATIALQLQRFDIPRQSWENYLGKLLQELPDWHALQAHAPQTDLLAGLLAIRLTLDRLWLNQICHDHWQIDAHIGSLRHYFEKNLSEFWVRRQLNQGLLPEYLAQQAQELLIRSGSERHCRGDWQQLADLILLQTATPYKNKRCWRLFRLCQQLGLDADHLQSLDKADFLNLQAALDGFDTTIREKVWRAAFEHHYRQALLMELDMAQHTLPEPSIHIVHAEELPPPHPTSADHLLNKHRVNSVLWTYWSIFLLAPLLLADALLKSASLELHKKLHRRFLAVAPDGDFQDNADDSSQSLNQAPTACAYIVCVTTDDNPDFAVSTEALQQLAATSHATPLIAHYNASANTLNWQGLNKRHSAT